MRNSSADQKPSANSANPKCERGKTGTKHIDAAGWYPIGQGNEHRDHHHVSGEAYTDQPAGVSFRQIPARDVAGEQRRQRKCPDLRQHLRGDDRLCVASSAEHRRQHELDDPCLCRHRRGRRPCLQHQQREKRAQAEAGRDSQHPDAHVIHQKTEK